MQNEIPKPVTPRLNAVDLPTSEPGIVNSKGPKLTIDRGNATVVPIRYNRAIKRGVDESRVIEITPKRMESSLKTAEGKITRGIERAEKKAQESIQKEELREKRRERATRSEARETEWRGR